MLRYLKWLAVPSCVGRAFLLLMASLAVVTAQAQPYVPGQSYFGRSNYVQYIAGNMPVIISAPHGGTLTPAELPDRTTNDYPDAVFTRDDFTDDLALALRWAFTNRYKQHPHVIICHLRRSKIDCNREIGEGAQGHVLTEVSWNDFQNFIHAAEQTISNQFGAGFFIDLHGHGHVLQRLELGYLLTDSQLGLSDAALNNGTNYSGRSSIRELDQRSPSTFAQLLRGSNSLGGLLSTRGYSSVPSPDFPDPGGNLYFDGGYNTRLHGSYLGGTISGVQIECNRTNVRDSAIARTSFSTNLVIALEAYFTNHFNMSLSNRSPSLSSLTNQGIIANSNLGPLALTVADAETPAGQLTLGVSSSNTNLVPLANIVIGGSGTNRTVTITPAPFQNGAALITITAADAAGAVASVSFILTVNPTGLPPELRALNYQSPGAGMRLRLLADSGSLYTIEWTDDLQGQTWSALFTVTNTSGVLDLSDRQATNGTRGFYRVEKLAAP